MQRNGFVNPPATKVIFYESIHELELRRLLNVKISIIIDLQSNRTAGTPKGGAVMSYFSFGDLYQFLLTVLCMIITYMSRRDKKDDACGNKRKKNSRSTRPR